MSCSPRRGISTHRKCGHLRLGTVDINTYTIFFFSWHYNPSWVLTCSTVLYPQASYFSSILHCSQLRSDITLPSLPLPANPSYCSWSPLCYSFHCLFFVQSYNMPSPSHSLHFYESNYICMFDWQIYFPISSYSSTPILILYWADISY